MAKRGFGSPKYPRDIHIEAARKGGLAVQASGKAYQWDKDAARKAGSKGGTAARKNRRIKQQQDQLAAEMKERM